MYQKFHSSLLALLDLPETLLAGIQSVLSDLEAMDSDKKQLRSIYGENSQEIKQSLFGNYSDLEEETNKDFFSDFSEIYAFIEKQQEVEIRQQEEACFLSSDTDSWLIRVKKLVKRKVLRLHWGILRIWNSFRKILGLTEIPLNYWKHKIHLRRVAELVYLIRFLELIKSRITSVFAFKRELFVLLKDLDEQIERKVLLQEALPWEELRQNLMAIQEKMYSCRQEIDDHFASIKDKLDIQFREYCDKYGTIEFPSKRANRKLLLKQRIQHMQAYKHEMSRHRVQCFALFEHWRLRYNLRFAMLSLADSLSNNSKEIGRSIEEELLPDLDQIEGILQHSIKDLENESNPGKIVDSLLQGKLLKKLIPQYFQRLLEVDLTGPYDEVVNEMRPVWETFAYEYVLPRKSAIEELRSAKQFRSTSISNVLMAEYEELVVNQLGMEKNEMLRELQNSLSTSNEVAEIIEYAIDYYQTSDEGEDSPAYTEFVNGVERACKKAEENVLFLKSLKEQRTSKLNKINGRFIQALLLSTSLEKLFVTQNELYRKQRIRQGREAVLNFFERTVSLLQKAYQFLKSTYLIARDRYSIFRKQLGLSSEMEMIGSELSNYLSDTETAISRLPLMYQKLFATVPLTGEKFRICRPQVLHQLGKAYSSWTSDNYAPACLVGEAGSGTTTLLNMFVEQYGHQYPVTRIVLSEKILAEKEFVEVLKELFPSKKFQTMDDLIKLVAEGKSKRIVIVENIEKLFLRKNGGFQNLHRLFHLISQTNGKIFWLCSCKLYGWQYLDYTHHIESYFAHSIYLDTLDRDQIIEVIATRHKPSGFKLNFLSPDDFRPTRSFQKLSEQEKQAYLKEDYFNRLYAFARSNLTLALVFWMRSVVNVEDNQFYIQFRQLSYSFFNAMTTAQVTSLHALLIHEGLSVQEHAEVFGWTLSDSLELLVRLKDDGIINRRNGQFYINPLLYRQMVEHLKALNFVH